MVEVENILAVRLVCLESGKFILLGHCEIVMEVCRNLAPTELVGVVGDENSRLVQIVLYI